MRRAKPSAAFRANINAMGVDPAQRVFASINRQAAAALHSATTASSIMEALRTKEAGSTGGASSSALLSALEEAEDEESHRWVSSDRATRYKVFCCSDLVSVIEKMANILGGELDTG